MAWSLEIHHIDVKTKGDATLIVAREVAPLSGTNPIIRSALIDGGTLTAGGANVHNYIMTTAQVNELNVIAVTHYDTDHFAGVTRILSKPITCNNVRIYDQGWPSGSIESAYDSYLKAINGKNISGNIPALINQALQRTRYTNNVFSEPGQLRLTFGVMNLNTPAVPNNLKQNNYTNLLNVAADILLGQEILWDGYQGGRPFGAPTITCIAANKYIQTITRNINGTIIGTGRVGPIGGMGIDPRNEKSLAFLVQFNNFKYYIGGDIETNQENHIQAFLNPNNNAAGRIHVMKTSHHGSKSSSSRAFIDRLRPLAAIISSGTKNAYRHPDYDVINILDGYPPNPNNTNPSQLHLTVATPPLNRPVKHFLTGYQNITTNPPQSRGGNNSTTSGNPLATPIIKGNIVVRVSATQSNSDPQGQLYIGVNLATRFAAQTAGLSPYTAQTVGVQAAEAAVSFGLSQVAGAAATAAGFTGGPFLINVAINTLLATGNVVTAQNLADAVANAARGLGATNAQAAAAAAAAVSCWGGGHSTNVSTAVRLALTAVGVSVNGSDASAAALAILNNPGLFSIEYYSATSNNSQTVLFS